MTQIAEYFFSVTLKTSSSCIMRLLHSEQKGGVFAFMGVIARGDGVGTSLGFPTLNIHTKEKLQKGVFVTRIRFVDGNIFLGVLHIGARPTLKKKEIRVEAHLFNFSQIVPEGEQIFGEVLLKIREVQKFRNTKELQEQIAKDIFHAKKIIETLS